MSLVFVVNKARKVVAMASSYSGAAAALKPGETIITRSEFNTFEEAAAIAASAHEFNGISYLPIDNGSHVSPRYEVIETPAVGDEVSYGFNGDYYPDGTIVHISKSLKVIETSTGNRYFRRKLTGSWILRGTWALVHGHINERNPSF